ncbi:MAG TPA: class I SAM-dependent methyltransferase [Polyangia bacterium]|nr:class I SAM-dependent methyltransferase [Polyangia bacterium]
MDRLRRDPANPGRGPAPSRDRTRAAEPSFDDAPRPPRQRRAFSTLGGPVEVGGEAKGASILRKLLDLDPAAARALTHGFHSYAGRMHPSIARGAIEAFSKPGETVVDPFCGSGTVLVEAMAAGRAAIGIDASALAVAIAGVRTTLLGEADRARLVAEAARISEEAGERARKRRRPVVPAWAGQEIARFHAHVLYELLGLRELVFATGEDAVGRALRLCLSSILVKFMKAGPEAPRDGEAKRIARGIPSRMLSDRAAELAHGLAALERRTPPGTPAPKLQEADARELPLPAGRAALVLSSPPYAGTYDYAAQHETRFVWLGLSARTFRRVQLGARASAIGDTRADVWHADAARFIAEIARVLRPGGHALLVVGDGVVGGHPEHAPDGVAAAGAAVGLEPIARASQARPIHDRRLAAIFDGRPRREHLLLLRKRDRH